MLKVLRGGMVIPSLLSAAQECFVVGSEMNTKAKNRRNCTDRFGHAITPQPAELVDDAGASVLVECEYPERWDVPIVCDDAQSGEFARWLLPEILPATGLDVQCETRPMVLENARPLALFQAALLQALNANLVILALRGAGAMDSGARQVLHHWADQLSGRTSPVAVLIAPAGDHVPGRHELLIRVQELCEDTQLPFFNSLSNALMEASERLQSEVSLSGVLRRANDGIGVLPPSSQLFLGRRKHKPGNQAGTICDVKHRSRSSGAGVGRQVGGAALYSHLMVPH